jgi:MFS transporter, putative metabolite:H+ symporter
VLFGFLMFTLIYFMVSVIVAGYIPELFPTAVRMRGYGITSTVGRLTTIFVPAGVVALFNFGGVPAVLLGVSAALVVQALLAFAYRIETNGRSLEAITSGAGGTMSGSYAGTTTETITR